MRILMHDFAGYPYPIQLSRELARRGHEVVHAYCGSIQTTPGGALVPHADDPATLTIERLLLREPLAKYAFVKRWRQENAFGRQIAALAERVGPDVVVSGNTPLDAQRHLVHRCETLGIPFVFWVQDLLSVATHRLLRRKLPLIGELIGRYYLWLERSLLRRSDQAVIITDDFRPLLSAWGVKEERMCVVENWAPLDELPVRPKDNAWARSHGVHDRLCLLYAGTMGMKHNPDLLLQLALRLHTLGADARVVVVSQGLGAEWLRVQAAEHGLANLLVLGFEPFERMPDVMGAADVLLAVLEPEAGVFSVPSKVLAYLCAARPLLLAIPPENLAARIVASQGAGLVVPPRDGNAFVRAGLRLAESAAQREGMGARARAYAEATFDIGRIADGFERTLTKV